MLFIYDNSEKGQIRRSDDYSYIEIVVGIRVTFELIDKD